MGSETPDGGGSDNSYISRLVALAVNRGNETLPPDWQSLFPDGKSRRWNELRDVEVEGNPSLQSALALFLEYPPSKWLLEQEVGALQHIRRIHTPKDPLPEFTPGRADVYDWARQGKLTGLCLSGGGIRSATFNLGILQGLAAAEVATGSDNSVRLSKFDYLSSVSGGGYIHAWLAGWFNRQAKEQARQQPSLPVDQAMREGFQRVIEDLVPPPKQSPKTWPRQIQWLRQYSNYLTPEKGVLSGDTWAMVATWLRNVLLNQSLLLSLFALLLMLPHLLATDDWVNPLSEPVVSQLQTTAALHSPYSDATLVLQLKTPATAPPTAPTKADQPNCRRDTTWLMPHRWWTQRLSWTGFLGFVALAIGIVAVCYFLRREYNWTREQDKLEREAQAAEVAAEEARRKSVALANDLQNLRARFDAIRTPESEQEAGKRQAFSERRLQRAEVKKEKTSAEAMAARHAAAENALHPKTERSPHEWLHVLAAAILPLFVFGGLISDYVISCGPDLGVFVWVLLAEFLALVWVGTFVGGAWTEWNLRSACEGESVMPSAGNAFLHFVGLIVFGTPAAVAGTLGGIGIALWLQSASMKAIGDWLYLQNPRATQMVFGTVLFAWLPVVVLVIAAGLVGKWFPSWLGEWLARIRGYTLMAGLTWFVICGISLLMPGVVAHAFRSGWIRWPAIVTWAGGTIASVLGGKSPKTGGQKGTSGSRSILDWLLPAGSYIYMLGTLVAVAWVLDRIHAVSSCAASFWLLCILVPGIVTAFFSYLLDINEFSMHSFYRNRLTRCYLGASNLHRDPSRITGFDDRDTRGLQIAQLLPEGHDHSGKPNHYPGPFPIFCCSMNITHGEDLGWQERKAASFAFTPLYSGYDVSSAEGVRSRRVTYNGYVPTGDYAYPGGPNLATAMATSGAAISPNWGYHTNPAVAFLLTMFDVRLGWWIPNPRRSRLAGQSTDFRPVKLDRPTPRFVPIWLAQELLGSITDTSAFVYLTDGGHFDNMGLYELVRRRCYRIVICDAEEDASYTYEGIGNAIRKCRLDFGVEIDLNLSDLMPNSKSKLSPAHFAAGTIRYPETPSDELGDIIYVKASLTGKPANGQSPQQRVAGEVKLPDVPGDVQNYKLEHIAFPHDSTLNQWFTESQFESYRRLGQKVASYIAW